MDALTLRGGAKMPMIGLGTWRTDAKIVKGVIKDAIDVGYRHFDCAHVYSNEREVGEAIQEKIAEGVIKREDIFITSKLWNTFHEPDLVEAACRNTLTDLQTNYLDLYLIHWPMGYKPGNDLRPHTNEGKILYSDVDFCDTWRAMELLVDQQLCHNIGLSNFNIQQIEKVLEIARIKPQVLQIENHPYLQQHDLIRFCEENEIFVTAYSPLGSGHTPYAKPGDFPLLSHPKVLEIANAHERTAAQVLLRFQLERDIVVVPRSINKEHMAANIDSANFTLTESEIGELCELDMGERGRILRMEDCKDHPYYPF